MPDVSPAEIALPDPPPAPRRCDRPVLPYVVHPLAYEPLHGWLFRAATTHGYPKPDVIGDLVGGLFPDLTWSPAKDENLAILMSADIDEIRRRAVRAVSASPGTPIEERPTISYFGHTLRAAHVDVGRLRVCPQCLRDQAALRNTWDFTLCHVCHIHGCELIEQCPQCKSPVGYNRRAVDVCSCGYHLKWAQPIEAPSSTVSLWRYLDGCLNGSDGLASTGIASDNPIRSLPLNRALDLVVVLSMFELGGGRASSITNALHQSQKIPVPEARKSCAVAAELIIEWPSRVEEEIQRRLQALPKGGALLRQAKGSIAALSEWALPVELAFLDNIVETCVSRRWQTFVGQARFDDANITCASLPISSATVDMAGRPSVPSAPALACDAMPVADAGNELGIEVRDVLGIFPSWHLSRRVTAKGRPAAPRVVSKMGVHGLRDELTLRMNPWHRSPLDSYRRFHEARSTCWHLGIDTADLIDMLRSGRVRLCQRAGERFALQKALLNEADLSTWWRQVATAKKIELIRVGIGRQVLNVDNATFEHLIEMGELPIPRRTCVLDDRMVPANVIFDAIDRLRIVRRLEDYCGIRTSELDSVLEAAGIVSLTGAKNSGPSGKTRIMTVDQLREPPVFKLLRERATTTWSVPEERRNSRC